MKSRFSVEQIIKILREYELAPHKSEVLQKHNISQQTYYRWRCKYQGMDLQEALRLKALEKENTELKKLLAEEIFRSKALEIAARKNFYNQIDIHQPKCINFINNKTDFILT